MDTTRPALLCLLFSIIILQTAAPALAGDRLRAEQLFVEAQKALSRSEIERAESLLTDALAADPAFTSAIWQLAQIYEKKGKLEHARELLIRGLQQQPDAAWALRCFGVARIERVVVSNQSAVARGLCGEDDVRAVNDRIRDLVRAAGGGLEAFYFCPHHPDHGPPCSCRKPEPGMLLRAAEELGLDLEQSVAIGDASRDLEAGARAGTATVHYPGSWVATCRNALAELLRRASR